jgi:putative ABC transport system permease protein
MSLLKRSVSNLIRSLSRTMVIVVMLAISLGMGLSLFQAYSITSKQLEAISGKIGTNIFVSPAGYEGPPSGNLILEQADINKLKNLEHVVAVQSTLSEAYSGNRPLRPGNPNGASHIQALSVLGLDPSLANPSLDPTGIKDEQITVVDGIFFASDDINANVMIVGQALAQANNLQVGSTVDIQGAPVKVIGIYSTGQVNNLIVMPLGSVQRLYKLEGANGVTVVADDFSNVNAVVQEIRTVFDAGTADVLTATQEYNKINANITGAVGAGRTGMIVTFAVAAAIILLAVFLVMRQRVREIGILKAIGASNWYIGLGFSLEMLVICVVSSAIGLALSVSLFAQNVNAVRGASVSPTVISIAIGATIILALLASLLPVWYIARVRPAEVLRDE